MAGRKLANHLHEGVRTLQRWELNGFPIHRVRAGTGSLVVAFVEELDAWHEAAPMRTLDVTRDLKIKVEQLDKEVRALKRQNRMQQRRYRRSRR